MSNVSRLGVAAVSYLGTSSPFTLVRFVNAREKKKVVMLITTLS